MSLPRVVAVMRKEVREFRRNRFVIGTMAVLPLVFLITPLVTMFNVPASASGAEVRSAVGTISLLLLIIPLVIPPVIAAYSVVGERDQATLEPVLGFTSLISFQLIAPSVPLAIGLALALLAADIAPGGSSRGSSIPSA